MSETFNMKLDGERLGKQLVAVRNFMLKDSFWWTLREIEHYTGYRYPQTSISARLRELRRRGFNVERRRRGVATLGIWEYKVTKRESEQLKLIA